MSSSRTISSPKWPRGLLSIEWRYSLTHSLTRSITTADGDKIIDHIATVVLICQFHVANSVVTKRLRHAFPPHPPVVVWYFPCLLTSITRRNCNAIGHGHKRIERFVDPGRNLKEVRRAEVIVIAAMSSVDRCIFPQRGPGRSILFNLKTHGWLFPKSHTVFVLQN